MPNPSSVLNKRKTTVGSTLLSDLGDDASEQTRPGSEATANPLDPGHDEPQVDPPSDAAHIKALVSASVRARPSLRHRLKEGRVAKDRTNVRFDPDTDRRLREFCLAHAKTLSALIEDVLPWIKSNADETSVRWAQQQLQERRQVKMRQLKAASEGAELPHSGETEHLYFPVKALSECKSLWHGSKLSKKGFLEACLYLYLEVHSKKA